MRKILLKSLLAIIGLLSSTNALAYDFEVNGIYYNILSSNTCEVTHNGDESYVYGNTYSGSIVIPETVVDNNRTYTVTGIGDFAFHLCSELTNVEIPNSVTSIGYSAFYNCRGLTSIEIPNSVTEIGYEAFYLCRGLTSITIPNSVTKIGDEAFLRCSSLTSIEIPNSVTVIGRYTFYGCTGLESVEIPNSVTEIGDYAFRNCSSLTSVEIPNSVTKIGDCAFHSCSSLTSVEIGNSITEIGSGAFYGCDALTTIYSLNTTPPSVESDNFTSTQYNTVNVFVPEEALEAYQSADVWKKFKYLQGFDATGIESVKSDAMNGNNIYYDLNGNRLDAPKKGLNIINGKKVIVK